MHGVLAASATPFDANYHVDTGRLHSHMQWLLNNGCNGIVLFGTTGEANSVSLRERLQTITDLRGRITAPEKYIIGTGCCAVEDTVELTRQALAAGFRQILMLPPFYYKNISENGLLSYFSRIIESVDNTDLKIYLYHFPALTGVPFTHTLIAGLLKEFPGIIAGIKDSGGDFSNMQAMCEKFDHFEVFAGTERFLYPVLQAGGVGCISATVNVTVKLAAQIYHMWTNKEDAGQKQQDLIKYRTFLEGYPVIPAIKAILAHLYQDDGWRQTIPPHMPLNEDDIKQLLAAEEISVLLK